MSNAALPRDPLAAEIGSVVGTLERELRLQMAAGLSELREGLALLRLRVSELRDGEPGPPGPPGAPAEPVLYAPDDVAVMIGKAAAMLAEAPAIAPPQPLPPVVNVTVPLPAPRTERTRVTKHDEHGRIVEIERDVA